MRGGRKNLKRATVEQHVTLEDEQTIMQLVSLRGSNLIEVMDARGEKSLALFPAKFQKSMWIKRGNFVVVDEMEKRRLLNQVARPEIFKSGMVDDSNYRSTSQQENKMEKNVDEDDGDDDDDGIPPLEANTNRMRPFELQADEDSEISDTDDA